MNLTTIICALSCTYMLHKFCVYSFGIVITLARPEFAKYKPSIKGWSIIAATYLLGTLIVLLLAIYPIGPMLTIKF